MAAITLMKFGREGKKRKGKERKKDFHSAAKKKKYWRRASNVGNLLAITAVKLLQACKQVWLLFAMLARTRHVASCR